MLTCILKVLPTSTLVEILQCSGCLKLVGALRSHHLPRQRINHIRNTKDRGCHLPLINPTRYSCQRRNYYTRCCAPRPRWQRNHASYHRLSPPHPPKILHSCFHHRCGFLDQLIQRLLSTLSTRPDLASRLNTTYPLRGVFKSCSRS